MTHHRFYDLRHTCASLLLVQGVHPHVVMEILGHSQIGLTMNTYGQSRRAPTATGRRSAHGQPVHW
jgi:integrase